MGDFAALIVRYRGDGSSGKKPILFLGHMDVVEAYAKDWERPPFQLTSDDTNFYARGTIDNKFGVAQLTSTFIRLKKEGFVPTRDLIIAFSGDEESGMTTTRMLAYDRPDLAEAEFALNSDAGGGDLDAKGKAITYNIQAAEKTYATWEITVRNPGGHSSRPRPDNAIYDLAAAIKNIQDYQFPVQYSDMTRNYFRVTGEQLGGELGEAMVAFAENPNDEAAAARLAKESSYVGTTRTTCVVTMLQAGHAENALPQSATATVNCRVFPGVPVSEIEGTLRRVVANDAVEFRQTRGSHRKPGFRTARRRRGRRQRSGQRPLPGSPAAGLHGVGRNRRHALPPRRHSDLGGQRHLHEPGRNVRARPERARADQGLLRRPRPLVRHHPPAGGAVGPLPLGIGLLSTGRSRVPRFRTRSSRPWALGNLFPTNYGPEPGTRHRQGPHEEQLVEADVPVKDVAPVMPKRWSRFGGVMTSRPTTAPGTLGA